MKITGELHNLENTLINRTVAEEIDKHQMAIYHLMKSVFPEMIGYNASAIEKVDGDELDIVTNFNMIKEEKC